MTPKEMQQTSVLRRVDELCLLLGKARYSLHDAIIDRSFHVVRKSSDPASDVGSQKLESSDGRERY